jgi:hypothetical protein
LLYISIDESPLQEVSFAVHIFSWNSLFPLPISLLSGANFIFLVAYVLRLRRNRKAGEAAAASGGATMTNDPEMGMEENKNAAAMPPGFAGKNGEL